MSGRATPSAYLSWGGVARLGLVQAGIGAVVVLATSTLSRLMTVELALPALVPGALVALHYLVQLLRPRFGHRADRRGGAVGLVRGGMAAAGGGGALASVGVALWRTSPIAGGGLLLLGFVLLGLGVGGSGTALLTLLAERTAPQRRGPAATLTWFMMMVGFILSAGIGGAALKPYSGGRLVMVAVAVGLVATVLAWLATLGLGRGVNAPAPAAESGFREALRAVWGEGHTRRFAGVVFLAMLAYAGQELVLEPFAGAVFGLSPGASTQLMGLQRGGVLLGMAGLGLLTGLGRGRRLDLRLAMGWSCGAAALALALLAAGALHGRGFPLDPAVFALGVADGVFATAAVGAMMGGAGAGRAGLRMGVWGAAQALAYAGGGLIATGALQLGLAAGRGVGLGYGASFTLQALLFGASALASLQGASPAPGRAAPSARASFG